MLLSKFTNLVYRIFRLCLPHVERHLRIVVGLYAYVRFSDRFTDRCLSAVLERILPYVQNGSLSDLHRADLLATTGPAEAKAVNTPISSPSSGVNVSIASSSSGFLRSRSCNPADCSTGIN